MKRKNALVIGLACALTLVLGMPLVGCGTSSSDTSAVQADAKSQYVGYWEIASDESGTDNDLTEDDITTLKNLGLNCIIYLAEDGTGSIDIWSEVYDITWDADAGTLSTDEGTGDANISVADNTLTLSGDDFSYTFTKGTDSLADTISADRQAQEEENSGQSISDGTDGAATVQAIDPITVADDDTCTIIITEKAVDDWGDAGYTVKITNKSDTRISIYVPYAVTAVNGTMTELYGSTSVLAGANATEFFYFSDLDSIDQLVNVQTTFEVYDSETYEDIASYTVTIP